MNRVFVMIVKPVLRKPQALFFRPSPFATVSNTWGKWVPAFCRDPWMFLDLRKFGFEIRRCLVSAGCCTGVYRDQLDFGCQLVRGDS